MSIRRRLLILLMGSITLAWLLAALGASSKEDDQFVTVLREVYPVPRTPVDHILSDPPEPFDFRRVAEFYPDLGDRDFRGRLRIQAVEPAAVGATAVRSDVFFDCD